VTRIGFLTPVHTHVEGQSGGGRGYPRNLARSLCRLSGGAVSVDLLSFGAAAQVIPLDDGVTLHVLPTPVSEHRSAVLGQLSSELSARVAAVDLLHVHDYLTIGGEVGIMLAEMQGKAVCATDYGGGDSRVGTSLGLGAFVDRYVCPSDFGAALLRPSDPVAVVKGGVDPEFFTPPAQPPQREGYLYAGDLLPHKGIDRLIAALPSELPLTVVGTPRDQRYFRRCQRLARDKRVRFLTDGDDAQLRELYRHSWATVLPSVWRDCYGVAHGAPDVLGGAALESMACGTPVICSDVAALPEFVEDGVTGFVVSTQDQLAESMRRLATAPQVLDELGRNGRARAESEWSFDAVAAGVLDVYAESGLTIAAPAARTGARGA
jgi:glycosyltransferase involved in cell wall biosynthesis